MTKETKRYNYGVKLDLLHDKTARGIRARVTNVRDQAIARGYEDLDKKATENYEHAYNLFMLGRYKFEPRHTGERYQLLRRAKGLLVLTYRYSKVKWEVTKALEAGTPVSVFSPYKKPDMVAVTSVAQWENMCDREANPDWAAWMDELDINLNLVMDTPTPWLEVETLKELANQYVSFDDFLNYLAEELTNIKALGEWDVSSIGSLVYNEKASTWRNEKTREFGSRYKYANKDFWENYETLPVDIMTEYLHLTYLVSVDYKPLQRMYTVDDAEYCGKEIWLGTALEDMVRATPIYVDLNETK